MTDQTPALPQAGGSYIRDPDGTLRPAETAAPATPAKPNLKGPVKAPVKES